MENGHDPALEESLHEMERHLFSAVEECPEWSALSHAREILRREIVEITRWRLSRGEDSLMVINDLTPKKARQVATFHLAGIASRAAGSVVALIACGYVPEAKASLRRLREASLRARSVIDDESGHHARAWLSGRPLRGLAHLESRYGGAGAMKWLSPSAHADVTGTFSLLKPDESRVEANLAPHRDEKMVETFFRLVALEILGFIAMLTTTHPQYLSSELSNEIQELQEELKVPLFNFGTAFFLRADGSGHIHFKSDGS